jgi:hypothetical protein
MTDEPHGRRAEGNAGAFLAPEGMIPAPMDPVGSLGDAPPEPDDPAQPATVAPRRGLLDTLLGRNPPPPRDV